MMVGVAAVGRIDLPYVHNFRDRHGHERAYFRYRGRRWPLPAPGDPEFGSEYRRLKEKITGTSATAVNGEASLGWLIREYQASPEFRVLRPRTRSEYVRALSAIGLEHGTRPWKKLTTPAVLKHIRDPLADTPRKADMHVEIVSALYSWAIKRGMTKENPALGAPRLYRRRTMSRRPWTMAEARRFCEHANETEYLIFTLALYTGQRAGDLHHMTCFQYDGQAIRLTQEKTDHPLVLAVHPTLKAVLDARRKTEGRILPFASRESLSSFFSAAVRRIGGLDGCTLHGLRSTHATWIAEAGGSAHQIGASTGHRSPAMVKHYTAAADQRRLAQSGIALLPDMPRTTSGNPTSEVATPKSGQAENE